MAFAAEKRGAGSSCDNEATAALATECEAAHHPLMVDSKRKAAILTAEREFERKEILSQALAEHGVILVGAITSPPPDAGANSPQHEAE